MSQLQLQHNSDKTVVRQLSHMDVHGALGQCVMFRPSLGCALPPAHVHTDTDCVSVTLCLYHTEWAKQGQHGGPADAELPLWCMIINRQILVAYTYAFVIACICAN